MLHGFAGSGVLFYRLISQLRQFFNVTTIDILGMGCSGRPPYSTDRVKSAEEAIEYFNLFIEAWMLKTGYREMVGDGYILVGHSFGGHLSTHYAIRFPEKMIKLILLSPVGVQVKPEGYDQKRFSLQPTKLKKFKEETKANLWEKNWSPMSVARGVGGMGTEKWLTTWTQTRILVGDPAEQVKIKNFVKQAILRPKSAENAVTQILSYGAWARVPLFPILYEQNLKIPVLIAYGDDDWMISPTKNDGSLEKLFTENKLHGDSVLMKVERAGHHLYIDNYKRTASYMIQFLYDIEKADQYLISADYEF